MDVVNPDQDITAPGVCTIRVNTSENLAWVYLASGKAHGKITLPRITMMHTAFQYTRQHHPEIHAHYMHPSFEHAVMKLLSRYKNKHRQGNSYTKKAKEWCTPDNFMKGLSEGLSLTTERFASPLSFSPHLSSTAYTRKTSSLEPTMTHTVQGGQERHKPHL